jgi:UPF0755 protein
MKRKSLLIIGLLLLIAGLIALRFLSSNTAFPDKSKALLIRPGDDKQNIEQQIGKLVKNPGSFTLLAGLMNYWDKIKPGRYEIKKGESLLTILRRLRSGNQSPVRLVINKLRYREDFAKLIGKNFDCDSATFFQFISSNDSLQKFGIDTNTVMTAIIPDTYLINWNSSAGKIFEKLYNEGQRFWTTERKAKAEKLNHSPTEMYIIASIVEEETTKLEDKGKIASVYMNRLKIGMPLQADPTIIFGGRWWGIKRVTGKELALVSPYNSYKNKGLPPGPICTPSPETLNATLDAPETDYLYFVANPTFNNLHVFNKDYAAHQRAAAQYIRALDSLLKSKQR